MRTVFISYSRKSEDQVQDLIIDLKKLGHNVLSDNDLAGGQPWWEKILIQIENADAVILAVDETIGDSIAVDREYNYAKALNIPVMPVVVSGEIRHEDWPSDLADIQSVDYRGDHRDGALFLAKAFAQLPPRGPEPQEIPSRPPMPKTELGYLNDRVMDPKPMGSGEQSEILIELRAKMRIKHDAAMARKILTSLRQRKDLLKSVDSEIGDALSIKTENNNSDSSDSDKTGTSKDPKEEEPSSRWDYVGGGACIAFIFGLVIGGFDGAVVLAPLGAIAGFIASLFVPTKAKPET